MIKTTLIGLAFLGSVGTSAMAVDTVKPETIELTTATLMFSLDETGFSTNVVEKSDYALRLKTKKGRVIAIRF